MKHLPFLAAITLLLGCASPKLITFSPWNSDTSTWIEYSVGGVRFDAPQELRPFRYNAESMAVCLSAWVSPHHSVPNEEITIRFISGQFTLADYVALRSTRAYSQANEPRAGFNFWGAGGYGNKDNSRGLREDSFVDTIIWGYVFELPNKRLCEVTLNKWCRKPYREIDPYDVVTPEERELVHEIVRSVRPVSAQ